MNFLEGKIKGIDGVKNVIPKTKEEWKLEMGEYNSSFSTIFENYEDNPLLDSFVVTVKDIKFIDDVNETILKMDKIESANYGENTINTLISVFDIVEKATMVVVIALIFVTAFLILYLLANSLATSVLPLADGPHKIIICFHLFS